MTTLIIFQSARCARGSAQQVPRSPLVVVNVFTRIRGVQMRAEFQTKRLVSRSFVDRARRRARWSSLELGARALSSSRFPEESGSCAYRSNLGPYGTETSIARCRVDCRPLWSTRVANADFASSTVTRSRAPARADGVRRGVRERLGVSPRIGAISRAYETHATARALRCA